MSVDERVLKAELFSDLRRCSMSPPNNRLNNQTAKEGLDSRTFHVSSLSTHVQSHRLFLHRVGVRSLILCTSVIR